MIRLYVLTLVSLCLSSYALADPEEHLNVKPAPKILSFLKQFEGNWTGSQKTKEEDNTVKLQYRLVSGGTAVEERLFAGNPHEMITMYHGNEEPEGLFMTHYCMLGNQPRMKLTSSSESSLTFSYHDGIGIDPSKDGYMGGMKLTKLTPNSIRHEWTFFEHGKAQKTEVFEFQRVK